MTLARKKFHNFHKKKTNDNFILLKNTKKNTNILILFSLSIIIIIIHYRQNNCIRFGHNHHNINGHWLYDHYCHL